QFPNQMCRFYQHRQEESVYCALASRPPCTRPMKYSFPRCPPREVLAHKGCAYKRKILNLSLLNQITHLGALQVHVWNLVCANLNFLGHCARLQHGIHSQCLRDSKLHGIGTESFKACLLDCDGVSTHSKVGNAVCTRPTARGS